MRWLIGFGASSLGAVGAVLLILWAIDGFRGLGLDTAGTIAVVIGVTFSCGLGVALMSLIFYSERSNTDVDVYRVAINDPGGATERDPVNDARDKREP